MEEAIHVKFNDHNLDKKLSELEECSSFNMKITKNIVIKPTINYLALDAPRIGDPSLDEEEVNAENNSSKGPNTPTKEKESSLHIKKYH